jgi:hypothetical protein
MSNAISLRVLRFRDSYTRGMLPYVHFCQSATVSIQLLIMKENKEVLSLYRVGIGFVLFLMPQEFFCSSYFAFRNTSNITSLTY